MFPFLPKNKFKKDIEEHRPRLLRLACSWCHDADLAGDLVQDTCIKALERSAQLKEAEKFSSWITRILVNTHRDHLRKQKDLVELDEATLIEEDDPGKKLERQNTTAFVRSIIAELGEEQRKVLTLVDLSQFTYAEVASILGIPIGTVMSRLCRARARLKILIEQRQNNKVGLRRVK